jgi:hypothetical protein
LHRARTHHAYRRRWSFAASEEVIIAHKEPIYSNSDLVCVTSSAQHSISLARTLMDLPGLAEYCISFAPTQGHSAIFWIWKQPHLMCHTLKDREIVTFDICAKDIERCDRSLSASHESTREYFTVGQSTSTERVACTLVKFSTSLC